MSELHFNNIAYLCPHCASKNISEDKQQWSGLDATTTYNPHPTTKVTLDYEGEDYFLYFFKCNDCGTTFCVKRLHTDRIATPL